MPIKCSRLIPISLACCSLAAFAADPSWPQPGTGKAANSSASTDVPKLVWAHYVGWGHNFADRYDTTNLGWSRLDDRPLGNKWTSTDTGISSTVRNQIVTALQYDIDGFTVDLPNGRDYAGALQRFYDAAEGLPFYISICVDNWMNLSIDETVQGLADWFQRYGKHPNNYYIDDKPVIFIYNASRPAEECAEVVDLLKARGYEAFWLIQAQPETSRWENTSALDAYLNVYDGLYDFGSNGFTQDELNQRFARGRAALAKAGRPNGGLLAAGITRGYNGTNNAFYRPMSDTGSLRMNWEAALKHNADWITITTWNDYAENTHFEPAVWGQDSLLRLNREYIRLWRGEPSPARPPEVFITYKNEVRLGDDWKLELQGFPYSTEKSTLHVRLGDETGRIFETLPPLPLAQNEHILRSHRLTTPGMTTPRTIRIWTSIISDKTAKPAFDDWRELYPVVIRSGHMRDYQTICVAMSNFTKSRSPALRIKKTDANEVRFETTFNTWSWVGKAELLRNGRPVSTQEIAKNGHPVTDIEFILPKLPVQNPRDLYVVRLLRADGILAWSEPLFVQNSDTNKISAKQETMQVVVRGADFDELWSSPFAQAKEIKNLSVNASEIFGFRFTMGDENAVYPQDIGGWHIFAYGGGQWGGDRSIPEQVPQPKRDGERAYYNFDGEKQHIVLQPRSLPHDVLTLEAVIRPQKHQKDGFIFSDQNRAFDVGITPEGKLFVERSGDRLISSDTVSENKWAHVAAIYDGTKLRLFINGHASGEKSVPATIRSINSIPTIGCRHQEHMSFSHHYHGDIDDLAVTGRVLEPSEFILNR